MLPEPPLVPLPRVEPDKEEEDRLLDQYAQRRLRRRVDEEFPVGRAYEPILEDRFRFMRLAPWLI